MYKMVSPIECGTNVEINETAERDPKITAIRPQNCEEFAWLRWHLQSAASAIQ